MSEWDEDTGPYCGGGHYASPPESCLECAISNTHLLETFVKRVKQLHVEGTIDMSEFDAILNLVSND